MFYVILALCIVFGALAIASIVIMIITYINNKKTDKVILDNYKEWRPYIEETRKSAMKEMKEKKIDSISKEIKLKATYTLKKGGSEYGKNKQ